MRPLKRRVLALALILAAPLALLIQAACGGSDTPTCPGQKTSCNGQCVSTTNDPSQQASRTEPDDENSCDQSAPHNVEACTTGLSQLR